jgi:hypothetical protein
VEFARVEPCRAGLRINLHATRAAHAIYDEYPGGALFLRNYAKTLRKMKKHSRDFGV